MIENEILDFLIQKQVAQVEHELMQFMFKNHLFLSDMVENVKRISKENEPMKEYWYYQNIPIISTEIKLNCYE